MSDATAIKEFSPIESMIVNWKMYAGEITIEIHAKNVVPAIRTLKEEMGFNYLSDITGSDMFTDEKRFEIAYNLVNLEGKKRIRVSLRIDENDAEVDSITDLFGSANWYEREVYDMLGIRFRGNEDLRRIYMPEDFEYYPLRKEFPLLGIQGSIQLPEKDAPKGYK